MAARGAAGPWAGAGLLAAGVALRVPASVLRRWSGPGLLAVTVLLLAVLVPGIGVKVYGARKWFDLGVGYLQPSEVAKLMFALWGAHLLALRDRRLTTRALLVPLVPVFGVLAGLIVLEPDLGTTVSFLLIVVGWLWFGGAPKKVWFWLIVAVGLAAVALVSAAPYRAARFTSFLDPFADPTGSGFQAVEGMYALASGGMWGVGLGNSQTKWGLLPNAQSDYIFAIIGEELGFLGCVVLIGLYGLLAYAGFRIARRSTDRFAQLASATITVWLIGQATMNMGYVVGLLPVTRGDPAAHLPRRHVLGPHPRRRRIAGPRRLHRTRCGPLPRPARTPPTGPPAAHCSPCHARPLPHSRSPHPSRASTAPT